MTPVLPAPLAFHPLANLFPLIEGEDFGELVADIRENGLQDDIILLDGMILDGRNRYRALRALAESGEILGPGWKPLDGRALEPKFLDPEVSSEFADYDDKAHGDPLAYVLSKNLRRRHLTESQRAMVAAGIANLDWGGDRAEAAAGDGEPEQGANLRLAVPRHQAAGLVHVSERSVDSAAKVLKTGVAELGEAVRQGRASVSAAAEIARLEPADQKRIIAELANQPETKRAFTATVKELRRERQDEKKQRRESREAELGARLTALPDRKYGVILCDDEWDFEVYSRDTGMDRHAANHYPVSADAHSAAEMHARTASRFAVAAADCACFMWTTAPHLAIALELMRLRGFAYKSHVIWRKAEPAAPGSSRAGRPVLGTGYVFRSGHEVLLYGTRGNVPAPAMGDQWPSIVDAPPRRHSEKPDWQYELAEAYFPNLPKIELNARRRRPGWDAWGLEAPDEDTSEESRERQMSQGPATIAGTGDRKPEASLQDRIADAPELASVPAGTAATECTEAATRGEPSPEAGPQAEASLAGTGTGTPAGHAAASEGGGANAPATSSDDLDVPPWLFRVTLDEAECAFLRRVDLDAQSLNERQLVRKLRDTPDAATALDRQYLAKIVARTREAA